MLCEYESTECFDLVPHSGVAGRIGHKTTFGVGLRRSSRPYDDDQLGRLGVRVVDQELVGDVPLADFSL